MKRFYEIAGAAGLIGAIGAWSLLSYFRVGGVPAFLVIAFGALGSGLYLVHLNDLQRRRGEFGTGREFLLVCSPWMVAALSLPIAMAIHFRTLVGLH